MSRVIFHAQLVQSNELESNVIKQKDVILVIMWVVFGGGFEINCQKSAQVS